MHKFIEGKGGGLNELERRYSQTHFITEAIQVAEGRKYSPRGPHVGQP